jgi:signal transduction histidine kinase
VTSKALPFWHPSFQRDAGPRPSHLLHLVFALFISQVLFWGVVLGATALSPLGSKNLARYEVRDLSVSQATSLSDATPLKPWAIGVRNDWDEIRVDAPGLYRFTLAVKSPDIGAGVFVPYVRDNATLWVNNTTLGPPSNGNWTSRPGLLGLSFSVPPSLLRPGNNEIVLLVQRDSQFTRLGHVYAGPAKAIGEMARAHSFTKVFLPLIALTISVMLALVAIALIPLGVERGFLYGALATAVTIGVGTLFYLDTGVVTSPIFWLWYGNSFGAIGGYLAFVCLINAWADGPKWVYQGCLVTFTLIAIGTAIAAPFLVYEAVSIMFMIAVSAVMAVALPASLYLLGRLAWSQKKGDHWLAAVLLITPLTALVDLVLSLLGEPQAVYFAPLSNLTLLIAVSLALARRGGVLYRQAEQANIILTKHIAAKEAELDTSAKALRAQEAETVIQRERARIMRDVHDGMGGQLLNLLMQARDPDFKREELEETVETAITDLRLLIDSLDSVGDDLEIALAMFKERLVPRLANARVGLDWPSHPLTLERKLTAGEILSIYRILQEAISNALRHGKPTRIEVAQSGYENGVVISIDDNGVGMAPDVQTGRGLANMRRRAAEFGGAVAFEKSLLGGVRVILRVPEVAMFKMK